MYGFLFLSDDSDLPPPGNVHHVASGHRSRELVFSWKPVSVTNCPTIEYAINTTESCGECPSSTSDTRVKCINVKEDELCTFSVLTKVCGILSRSEIVNVNTATTPTGSQVSNGEF